MGGEAAEVEGLGPAFFVEVGCEVVVAGSGEGLVGGEREVEEKNVRRQRKAEREGIGLGNRRLEGFGLLVYQGHVLTLSTFARFFRVFGLTVGFPMLDVVFCYQSVGLGVLLQHG